MDIEKFSEDHPVEFIMSVMEIEGVLVVIHATLSYLLMLMQHDVI